MQFFHRLLCKLFSFYHKKTNKCIQAQSGHFSTYIIGYIQNKYKEYELTTST